MGHTLEFLLAFDGRIHHLEEGYWIKFDIRRVDATEARPHGLSYSLTLHAPGGARLVGFDNAHQVSAGHLKKRTLVRDHWHASEAGPAKAYAFKDADTLLQGLLPRSSTRAARARNSRNGGSGRGQKERTMKRFKIQSMASLEEEMRAVARGERKAPADAAQPSFNSVEALVRLLTPENRRLLALIRDRKPGSVAELVELTGRAQPNLTRTLAKLEAAGFITTKAVGRRKAPSTAIKKIVVEIDPCAEHDRVRVA